VEESQSRITYGYILDQVHKSGGFRIVERGELDKALEEMALSATDAVDDTTAVEIGKFTGAEYILLSSLAAEGGRLYISMRVISVETGQVVNTSSQSAASFDRVERLARQSVKSLLGGETEKAEAKRYLTLGTAFRLGFPVGPVRAALGSAYAPTAEAGLNLGFRWGVILLGITSGTLITHTDPDAITEYGLYSIPAAASLAYQTSFTAPFFLFLKICPGAALNVLRYPDSETKGGAKSFYSASFFLSSDLGVGFLIGSSFEVTAFASFALLTFAADPYMSLSPGMALNLRRGS
jgi:hypothetical protein